MRHISDSSRIVARCVGIVFLSSILVIVISGQQNFRSANFLITQKVLSSWPSINIGMSSKEVVSFLGQPIRIERYPKVPAEHMSRYVYWTEVPNGKAFPMPLQVSVTFCNNGDYMVNKEEPYCGQISSNGVPTTPILLQPTSAELLDGCLSKNIDFRWTPSHGWSPKWYYLEITNCTYGVSYSHPKVHVPYACVSLPLSYGHFLWRVCASNRKGQSEWSEWRTFDCFKTIDNKVLIIGAEK